MPGVFPGCSLTNAVVPRTLPFPIETGFPKPPDPVPHDLDLDAWARRPQFEFYRRFDNPFFNVCVDIDVTALKAWVDAQDASFFLASLYASQRATEAVPNFRYRLDGDRVRVQDRIVPGCTVLRDDETFGFGYFEPADTFDAWQTAGRAVIEHVQQTEGLDDRPDDGDVLHYSVLPWISFRSFSHARSFGTGDSVPKIVLGRYEEREGRLQMPVSVAVHHGLMDGLHVGRYVEHMTTVCAEPERLAEPRQAPPNV
jgi:chloramphenicol O-acetyltransferase type A